MLKLEVTISGIDYESISKARAKVLFNQKKRLFWCANKMNPRSPWTSMAEVDYSVADKDFDFFYNDIENQMIWYNHPSMGKKPRFYCYSRDANCSMKELKGDNNEYCNN